VVWFGSPHGPHQAANEDLTHYSQLFADEENKNRRRNKMNFLGEVTGMDRAYGRLHEAIRQLGIEENTVLWYTSDNGALNSVGSTGGFRGHKGQVYEGGLLVPSILHWPARFKSPMENDRRCNSSDIFPTILDFAGIEYASDRPMDGHSLSRIILGEQTEREKPMGFWDYQTNGRSVPAAKLMSDLLKAQSSGTELAASDNDIHADRLPTEKLGFDKYLGHAAWIKGDWKLHRIENEKGVKFELYDLENDQSEKHDLADEKQQIVDELKPELMEWLRSVAKSYNGGDYDQ